MSHIRDYRVLLWATSVSRKYQTRRSPKQANGLSSDFFLLSFFLRHTSMLTAEAITMISNTKKWHKSLGTALTTYHDHSTPTINSSVILKHSDVNNASHYS